MAVAPDPLAQVGNPADVFKNPGQLGFVQGLLRALRDRFALTVMTDRAAPQVLLQAPGGATYSVTVGDDGTLKTTAVSRH